MILSGRPRLAALDVLRGFALCGILLVNIPSIAQIDLRPSSTGRAEDWMGLFVVHRFFPIFSLLFGIGFSLLLDTAADRVTRPRVVLLRRLLVLLAFGLMHLLLLWPGDILTAYALVGLLVLLPSTWLPRWVVAGLAVALVVAALLTGDGGITLVPGLFLVGSTLVRAGVIDRVERSIQTPALLALVFAAGAAPVLWWQVETQAADPSDWGTRVLSAVSGLLVAGLYVCALLVLLRTPLRPALRAVFVPLGRMALTNYLTATVLVLAASRILWDGQPESWSVTTMLLVAGAVLTIQWLWSTLWLRRYRHGPLEWLWRWATWAHRPPLRRANTAAARTPATAGQ
ncbi:DUF418 domain-containing protein [Actinopolymorpha sp. B11F2]|uniref:DUF418 domain-containing protein n=1 Tax=Actinopolymorpha sp. B11F2 TaxID=3160862 RepID=UPI0032E3E31E